MGNDKTEKGRKSWPKRGRKGLAKLRRAKEEKFISFMNHISYKAKEKKKADI
jgi:hypothetical protein